MLGIKDIVNGQKFCHDLQFICIGQCDPCAFLILKESLFNEGQPPLTKAKHINI